MDHLEPAIFPLTAQSDLIQHKKARQVGQITTYSADHSGDVSLRQAAPSGSSGTETPPSRKDSPIAQAAPLARAQTCFAAARAFCLGSWGAKSIKLAHTSPSNPAHSLHIALRSQRQKTAQSRQCQSVAYGGREDAARSDRRLPKLSHPALQPDETAASTSHETRICAVSS